MEYLNSLVPPTVSAGKPGHVLSDRTLSEYDQRPLLCTAVALLEARAMQAIQGQRS